MLLAFIIAIVAIATDQLLKLLVTSTLQSGGTVTILGGLVKFFYCENKGMAFGMLQNQRWLFIVFTIAVILGIIIYLIKVKPMNKVLLISLGLIIGGGIGNLIDRVYLSYVVDYIQLSFFSPVCNFADYCITAGTIMLVVYILFFNNESDKKISRAE